MKEHEIVEQVYKAKEDREMADKLIRDFLPFIKAETAKFMKRPPQEGVDDELSIAMFAFHESIMGYSKIKGAFLKFAAMQIRHRLIDYYRKEKKHMGAISIYTAEDSEEDITLIDKLDTGTDEVEELHIRSAAKEEILEFSGQLQEFGLSLMDIADNCPKQGRTLEMCHLALDYAKKNPEILDTLVSTKKLPLSSLAEGAGVKQKTLERHRRYMVAILLAFTNGFEIIRGHLVQISPRKEVELCAI